MMAAIWQIWLALGVLLATGMGQSINPTNSTAYPPVSNGREIGMSVSKEGKMVELASILPLTPAASKDIPPTGISGTAYIANPSNELGIQPTNIAFISCDSYTGEIGVNDVFGQAEQSNASAIVFYSQSADWCNLEDYGGTYSWIFSMRYRNNTAELLTDTNDDRPYLSENVYIAIAFSDSTGNESTGGNGSSSGSNQQNQNPLGPSPSTAVAMIILYSITGIITALFLVIITTGAVRAHRHPERYGPRNFMGRPTQSRARGLARAMLDTLPIVKFGERDGHKPADLELTAQSDGHVQTAGTQDATQRDGVNAESGVGAPLQTNETSRPRPSGEGGIAAATNNVTQASQAADAEHQGCSICTEDFEAGEDQRVLPCNHRFHPACIDPWLLNVSGTCPLCRIDLRPTTSNSDGERQLDEHGNPVLREGQPDTGMAPPLGPTDTAGERHRMSARRSIMLGIMGIGRPDRLTREERVLALRELRGQQLARRRREEQAAVAETPEEERSTRGRLRDLLGRARRIGRVPSPRPSDDQGTDGFPRGHPRHGQTDMM